MIREERIRGLQYCEIAIGVRSNNIYKNIIQVFCRRNLYLGLSPPPSPRDCTLISNAGSQSMDLGLLFILYPYQNIYSPTFIRAKKVSSPSDIYYGPLLLGQLLTHLRRTYFDLPGQSFGEEGNNNIIILRKNDPITVGIDPYDYLKRLFGGLDEIGYLRLTSNLARALEQAELLVFGGYMLLQILSR